MSFKPYRRFCYDDVVFVRNNIRHLIPSGLELTHFHEEEFENLDAMIIRASIMLVEDGLPSCISDLNVEIYENAISHLEFFLSDSVADILSNGMNYSDADFGKWRVLLTAYMLKSWFVPETALRILIHTPRCLNPIGILRIPTIARQFESDEIQSFIGKYLRQENLNIALATRLVGRLSLFGVTNELLKVFNPHPYINYGPAMNAVTKYINEGSKKSQKLAATLITIYFPAKSIEAALRA